MNLVVRFYFILISNISFSIYICMYVCIFRFVSNLSNMNTTIESYYNVSKTPVFYTIIFISYPYNII